MAMGDCIALDVDDVFWEAQFARHRKRHGRERIVDLS